MIARNSATSGTLQLNRGQKNSLRRSDLQAPLPSKKSETLLKRQFPLGVIGWKEEGQGIQGSLQVEAEQRRGGAAADEEPVFVAIVGAQATRASSAAKSLRIGRASAIPMARIDDVKNMNWCKIIADFRHDALSNKMYQKGCRLHLMLMYVDRHNLSTVDLVAVGGMGRTCVYVHHVDKDAFLKGNIDPDPDELDMVFDLCPSYGELLEQVRKDLNLMDSSDVVEFDGRHNVGFGMHIRWRTMRVNSKQRWLAYKDMVAESLDKALELFAIKTNVPNLLDLNRVASPIVEAIPAPINEEANIEHLSCVDEANKEVNIEPEPLVEANDEHDDDENGPFYSVLGDLDKYNLQETMDHSIPYSRGYASESDDEGPDE
ncbi:hypothetical protein D1007_00864 [Hordeum vulgare]|nr:hypothetical protein D1007_00864 [Hordeum vulgare]